MVVRIRKGGPPPFNNPSADADRGLNCPTSFVIFNCGNAEIDPAAQPPCPRSHEPTPEVARKAHSHIARGGMQERIGETAIAQKLHRDRPGASFHLRAAAELVKLHAPAAGGDAYRARRACQPHAAAFGLRLHRTINIAQIQDCRRR